MKIRLKPAQTKLTQAKPKYKISLKPKTPLPLPLPLTLPSKSATSPVPVLSTVGSPVPSPVSKPIAYDSSGLPSWHHISDPRNPYGPKLTLDSSQIAAVELALSGKSFALVGEAGKGKTLAVQAICQALIEQGRVGRYDYKIPRLSSKAPRVSAPSIYLGAFTNKATGVLANKVLSNPTLKGYGFGPNIMTIHALLEFHPVYVWNEEKERDTRRFLPARSEANPLLGLTTLVIDESSMVGVGEKGDLSQGQIWNYLYFALPQDVQIIFVGDINQLAPVGGKSVLAYALNQLPIHELTTFHRQALESPIIAAAHDVLRGKVPSSAQNSSTKDSFVLKPWTNGNEKALKNVQRAKIWIRQAIGQWMEQGKYEPDNDIWLLPMSKDSNEEKAREKGTIYREYLGTNYINACIASWLDLAQLREVWTIVAGFSTHRLAIGDKVLIRKREAVITAIARNGKYIGKQDIPPPSLSLNHLGEYIHRQEGEGTTNNEFSLDSMESDWAADFSLNTLYLSDTDSDRDDDGSFATRAASHIVTIKYLDVEDLETDTLSTAGDFSSSEFSLGYALTVHKSQGSEWERVFILLHPCHTMLLHRELIYTAITRARHQAVVLGDKSAITRAIHNARIKGTSLEDKLNFFLGDKYIGEIDFSKLAA